MKTFDFDKLETKYNLADLSFVRAWKAREGTSNGNDYVGYNHMFYAICCQAVPDSITNNKAYRPVAHNTNIVICNEDSLHKGHVYTVVMPLADYLLENGYVREVDKNATLTLYEVESMEKKLVNDLKAKIEEIIEK